MGKVIFKIIIMVLPILVVIGLFRVLFHNADPVNFLPTYEELVAMFASAPDFAESINVEIQAVSDTYTQLGEQFGYATHYPVTDLPSFFYAIGKWFEACGQIFVSLGSVFKLLFIVIKTPVDILVWIVQFVLGFAPAAG